jgi:hypothetical protein
MPTRSLIVFVEGAHLLARHGHALLEPQRFLDESLQRVTINNRLLDLSGDVDKGFNRWRIEIGDGNLLEFGPHGRGSWAHRAPLPGERRCRELSHAALINWTLSVCAHSIGQTARQMSNHLQHIRCQTILRSSAAVPTHCCGSTGRNSRVLACPKNVLGGFGAHWSPSFRVPTSLKSYQNTSIIL